MELQQEKGRKNGAPRLSETEKERKSERENREMISGRMKTNASFKRQALTAVIFSQEVHVAVLLFFVVVVFFFFSRCSL